MRIQPAMWLFAFSILPLLLQCAAHAASDELVVAGNHYTGDDLIVVNGEVMIRTGAKQGKKVRLSEATSLRFSGSRTLTTSKGDVIKVKAGGLDGGKFTVEAEALGRLVLEAKLVKSITFPGAAKLYAEIFRGFVSRKGKYLKPHPWKGSLSLSYLATTGATETEMFSAAFKADRISGPWRFEASAKVASGRVDNTASAETSELAAKLERFLGPRSYTYLNSRLFSDKAADVDLRTTAAVGMGYRFLARPRHQLSGEAGYEYMFEDLAGTAQNEQQFVQFSLDYKLATKGGTRLAENAGVSLGVGGEPRTRSRSETSLLVKLRPSFLLKVSFVVEHDTEPPTDQPKTNTRTETALVWAF